MSTPPSALTISTSRWRGAIDDEAEIQLAIDGETFLDQEPRHPLAVGTGLIRHERLADQLARDLLRLVRTDLATLTPPALPRPPAWICALTTTTRVPSRLAMSANFLRRKAPPRRAGPGTPYFARIALAWYSWIFT